MSEKGDSQVSKLSQDFFLHLLRSHDSVEKHFESLSTELDFVYLKELSIRHNTLPFLASLISFLPENFISPAQKKEFFEESRTHVLRSLQLAREYTRISDLLTSSEIPHLPYKGPALAELYYDDPPLRCCSDLDIVVPKEMAVRSLWVLAENGFLPAFGLGQSRLADLPRITNHFMMIHPTQGWGVEIHWALFKEWQQIPFDLDPYWQKAGTAQEQPPARFSDEDLLVILCGHALKHSWDQVKWVMDLDRIIRSCENLDWQKVVALAKELGLMRGLKSGLLLADMTFATPLPDFLSQQSKHDKQVINIVSEIKKRWLLPEGEKNSYPCKIKFFLHSRERLRDKLLMCFKYAFSPELEDYLTWDFGQRVFLYRLLRPFTVIRKSFGFGPELPPIEGRQKGHDWGEIP